MNLEKFFSPKSIAIVGASSEEGKVGNVIAKNILNLGYQGEVFLVNPKHNEIFEKKCYKSLAEIEKEVDLAIIAVPAPIVLEIIKNGADKAQNFAVISAGFSEIEEEGKKREEELAKLAKNKKLNILGPNCLGFINPEIKLNASFSGGMPEAGSISFVTQSGALGVAFLDMAEKEKMKFSKIISIGNKMQLDEAEALEFLAEDKNTKVIGMYLESIKDGKKFIEMSKKISASKPVIILKAGRNEKAQRAIASHTGALAEDDVIISAAIKKAGAIRASDLEEFFNLLNLASSAENIASEKAVIITNAGGLGVLLTDAFGGKNIQLAELDEKIKKELRDYLPAESSVENPIDLLGDAREDRYKKALEIVSKISEIGIIICALTPQDQTPVEKISDEIVSFKKNSSKFIAAVFLGGKRVEAARNKFKENGIGSFEFPDLAVKAANNLYEWNSFRLNREGEKEKKPAINEKRKNKITKIIKAAQADGRQSLYYQEAADVLEMYGINVLSAEEIKLGEINFPKFPYPVALKIDSDKVLHKTDQKALALNIKNENELDKAIFDLQFRFRGSRIIAQPMAEKGMEIIAGIKRDKNFGPIIIYGLGGIYVEVFKMVEYLMPPISLAKIKESLSDGKLKFLFQETRGQKEYNREEIAGLLSAVCQMAMEIPEIREFDMNPLMIYNNGRKAVIADIKILI